MNGTQLNSFGFANSSLAVKPNNHKTGFDLDSEFDRSAITLTKIRNFSFSSGTGGTIVLGGTNNGNGLLRVKDSSGGTVITLDNSGILVTDGNIIVQNTAGGTVIDSEGIVSTTSFENTSLFNGAAGLSTTSTSYVDVSGGVVGTIVTTRSLNVSFFLMGLGYNSDFITAQNLRYMELTIYDSFLADDVTNIFINGGATTDVESSGSTTDFYLTMSDQMVSRSSILTLAAGTHSYKLRYRAVTGGTATLNAYEAGYIILGA